MRTANSFKNLITGVFGRVLYMVLNFVVRTVFIATLSENYLGVNGLLGSVLSVLSLTELGIGEAILFSLYKPVAEQDTQKIRSLLRLYRSAYRVIGGAVLVLGLCMVPFLEFFVRGTTELVDLRIVFVLYLLEMSSSYWMTYYSSVLYTEQKSYSISLISYISSFLTAALRVGLLLGLRKTPMLSFYIYALVGTVNNLVNNLLIRRKVRRDYPWTRDLDAPPLPEEERRSIGKNVAGMLSKKVCRVLNDGIDNMVISALIGIGTVGIYSNYVTLRQYVNRLLSTVFSSVTASIGNLCAVDSDERKESFFLTLQFTYFWVYGFCAICFWTLFNSFIAGVWLHDTKWLISDLDVFLVVLNFLLQGLAEDVEKYRDVNGLYWHSRYRYVVSSVLNVALSLVLVGPCHMGLTGALLGTTASILVMIAYDPVFVYREVFHKSAGEYYRRYLGNFGLILATGGLVHLLCLPFSAFTPGNFALRLLICLAVPNGLWYLLYRADPRFLYLQNAAAGLIRAARNKLRDRRGGEAQ